RFLQGGIERQVPAIDLLVDDRPDLPRPGIGAEVGADVAELGRKTQADGPVPLLRHREARADVGADELPSALGLDRAEQVEAGLEPVVEAARDLKRLVEGMMGGENTIFRSLAPLDSEVAVELNHGAVRGHGVAGIDLDFVVVLRARGNGERGERRRQPAASYDRSCAHRKNDAGEHRPRSWNPTALRLRRTGRLRGAGGVA